MSINPIRFNPKIVITEAKINSTTGDAIPVKALPDKAQIAPRILKIKDNPREKENICINNFLLLSVE